jgi:hypothetical protein
MILAVLTSLIPIRKEKFNAYVSHMDKLSIRFSDNKYRTLSNNLQVCTNFTRRRK